MKKLLTLMLALMLVVSVFAGCGSNKADTAGAEDPADLPDEAPMELTEAEALANNNDEDGSDEGVLIVGLDDHFPPMGYRDEANQLVGFDIDLAVEVANRLNMEVKLEPINWAAKEMELDTGKVDLLWNGLTITEERQAAMLITPAYLRNAQVVVVQVDSDIAAIADLAGASVAFQNGSSAYDAIENPENGLLDIVGETVGYDENVNALNDLEIGRIDALVVDKVVADYYLAQKSGVYRILVEELAAEEFGIAFKKDNTELYEKVCEALAEMVEDGTAARISEEWFGENRVVFES